MTFLLETARLGINNLRLHFLRSFLTALGIIIGVSAVIAMVSIGEGSKHQALMQIERLGARNIIVRSQKPPSSDQQQGQQARVARYGLTRADLNVIEQSFPEADQIVPLKQFGSQKSSLTVGRFSEVKPQGLQQIDQNSPVIRVIINHQYAASATLKALYNRFCMVRRWLCRQ